MRKHRTLTVGLALLIASMIPCHLDAKPKKSVPEKMADGAVILATMRFRENRTSEAGSDLLRFALYVDPDNEMGLLLQARLERNQEFEKLAFNDGGLKYVANMKSVINRTRSEPRRLLLYKVIELAAPDDEDALLALTKAKNDGLNTTLEGLINTIEEGSKTAEEPREAKVTKVGPAKDVRKVLHDTIISRMHLSSYSPTDPINNLNRHLGSHGVTIDMDVKKIPIRKYYDSTTGVPRFHINGEYRAPNMPQHWHRELENVRAEDVLSHICRMYDLGYKFEGTKVIITEPGDPGSVKNIGVQRRARDLVKEFGEEMASSTTRYRGKLVAVIGEVSGVGKAMSRDYVHLAGDKLRVVFDRGASESKCKELKDAYDSLGERRENEYHYSNRQYYVEFFGSARCKGVSSGRVTLVDCKDFSWRRLYRTTPNN